MMGPQPDDASSAEDFPAAHLPDAQAVDTPDRATRGTPPVVAIGASAGGVEALQRLFSAMPADIGCAYAVLMHLAPDFNSQLVPLLARAASMPVESATQGAALRPNHVYVLPPGMLMELEDGLLQLKPRPARNVKPSVVDRFMTSLARDQREQAIGVILSGTDGDGAIGMKAIKSEGGLALVQLPSTAAYPGMPSSAVATGVVDRQLPIEEIPEAIAQFVRDALTGINPAAELDGVPDLARLLETVRRQVGIDFSGYKRPMLHRRIRRRMGLSRATDTPTYIATLGNNRAEAQALATDFLISVTEFFREPDDWVVMARDIAPDLLDSKEPGDSVRMWVPGCATGEEAYSIAMVMLEQPQLQDKRLKLQVFATDIDNAALAVARTGRYPKAIDTVVSPQRLRRFFTLSGEWYTVRKELRDAVTVAPQNLAYDPPFSRMDLISCRNVLIYLQAELQRRVLQIFHYSLLPTGFLALGKSETVGPQAASFRAVSHNSRIFSRMGPPASLQVIGGKAAGKSVLPDFGEQLRGGAGQLDYAQAVRDALLEHRPTAAVLINRTGQALYFHGPVRRYIEFPEGTPTNDFFAMLDPALRPQLRAAIHVALGERRQVTSTAGVPVEEGEQPVRMVVSPVAHPATDELLLVTFEDLEWRHDAASHEVADGEAQVLRSLEEELRSTKRELRSAIEELEAANEELKVANEEAMSTNEELQSINEELETSQEELQSVNEELVTVNHQLQTKVDELELVNDDLNNLLASTSIPTLFLDRQLHIKRFTPHATEVFRLIAGDINRPLTDIASTDDTAAVMRDAREVLQRLVPIETETQTSDGRSYLRRTLPYRTQEDRIDGVVITFTDVTELRSAAEGLRRYAAVMLGSLDAVIVHDPNGRLLAWNHGAEKLYGYTEAQAMKLDAAQLLPAEERQAYDQAVQRVMAGETLQGVELRRVKRNGEEFQVSASFSLIHDEQGTRQAISLIERDVTPQKASQARLQESERRFRLLADTAPVLIWMADTNGMLRLANRELAIFVGQAAPALVGRSLPQLLHRDDRDRLATGSAS